MSENSFGGWGCYSAPFEPGPTQDFSQLKGEFLPAAVTCWDQGFCKENFGR